MLTDTGQLNAYINACTPPVGWDGEEDVDFFRLMRLISSSSVRYEKLIQKFVDPATLETAAFRILEKQFKLLSPERRELIRRCLTLRQKMLKEACRE